MHRHMIRGAIALLTSPLLASAALAQTEASAGAGPVLVEIPAGKTVDLRGRTYTAAENTTAQTFVSSEFFGVAVISGRLTTREATARPGDVLATTIEQARTRRYIFDAAVLARSLDPAQRAQAGSALDTIIARQRRQRFFGRLEPVGVNVRAPGSGVVEAIRSAYMTEPAIVDVRTRAKGDPALRHRFTAEAFATALAAGDRDTVAALLDPKPFTDISLDPAVWRAARLAFAARIVADGTARATAAAPPAPLSEPLAFALGTAFTLRLVDRDRATFVAALEPTS